VIGARLSASMKLGITTTLRAATRFTRRWKAAVRLDGAITRSLNGQWSCRWLECAVATVGTPLSSRAATPCECASLMWVWVTSTPSATSRSAVARNPDGRSGNVVSTRAIPIASSSPPICSCGR
jgi:hypothetical protein